MSYALPRLCFGSIQAGGTIHSEIACDKGYTSWYNTSAGFVCFHFSTHW